MSEDKTAILGGTFDPIHNGHLAIAQLVISKLNFDKIIFIPNRIQLLREQAVADPQQRLAMLKIAINNNINKKKYSINTYELQHDKPSYMVETLEYLKYPPDKTWLILGSDAFNNLLSWHNYEKLILLCNFIVINRANTINLKKLENLKNLINKTIFLDITPIDISSTAIRNLIFNNNITTAKKMVPKKVIEYIIKNNLYK